MPPSPAPAPLPPRALRTAAPNADEAAAGTPGHDLIADGRDYPIHAPEGAKWYQVQPMSSQPVAMEPLARR